MHRKIQVQFRGIHGNITVTPVLVRGSLRESTIAIRVRVSMFDPQVTPGAGPKGLVLAVNLDPDQAHGLSSVLLEENLALLTPDDIQAACETLRQRSPDLVICGTGSRAIDEKDLCRQLKSDPAIADIPVLL